MLFYEYAPYGAFIVVLIILIIVIATYPKTTNFNRISNSLYDLSLETNDSTTSYNLFPLNANCPTNPLTTLNQNTAGSCVSGPGSATPSPFVITYNSLADTTIYIKNSATQSFASLVTFASDSAENFVRGLRPSVGDQYFVCIQNLTLVTVNIAIFDLTPFTLASQAICRIEMYVSQVGQSFYENPLDAYTNIYRVDAVRVY